MGEQAKRRIAVVTDSTSEIPRELVEQYNIHVVPQVPIMGDKTWRDGVDIDSPTFYELLQTSPHFRATSQPSVVNFQQLFTELSQEADGIVAALVSDELSGALNSAWMAVENLPDLPIEIIDTRSVSLQLGFIALAAARAAAAGADLETVAATARALIGKAQVYFVVDTLEYLHRGGRIGGAATLVGTALQIKPVLYLADGCVEVFAKPRTQSKATQVMLKHISQQATGCQLHVAIFHADAPGQAEELRKKIAHEFRCAELYVTEMTPVMGAHTGPGVLGVVFYPD
jgi:DegV family protein with EDD domain